MYAILAIGLLTVFLSLIMIVSPAAWSRGILAFQEKPYFHMSEILSRLLLGGILLFFASGTLFPLFVKIVGFIFLFAGMFLTIVGSKRHREFAVRSSTFIRIFRPAGFVGFIFGAFIAYAAIA